MSKVSLSFRHSVYGFTPFDRIGRIDTIGFQGNIPSLPLPDRIDAIDAIDTMPVFGKFPHYFNNFQAVPKNPGKILPKKIRKKIRKIGREL
jgi:hypothetical protein